MSNIAYYFRDIVRGIIPGLAYLLRLKLEWNFKFNHSHSTKNLQFICASCFQTVWSSFLIRNLFGYDISLLPLAPILMLYVPPLHRHFLIKWEKNGKILLFEITGYCKIMLSSFLTTRLNKQKKIFVYVVKKLKKNFKLAKFSRPSGIIWLGAISLN